MAIEVRKTAAANNIAVGAGTLSAESDGTPPVSPTRVEIMELEQDVTRLKERLAKLKSLEAAIFQEDTAYQSELVKKRRRLSELISTAATTDCKERLGRLKQSLRQLEAARPSHVPFILWVALGSVKLLLPDRERLQYKASYERFKVFATVTHLMLSLILLMVPGHAWLDAASNFFLLYAYSTMTLRENILRLNGSAMQAWWIWHHYLCVGLAGLLVVWPAGPAYAAMRSHLLLFMVYIAAVQVLQYRYQMNRLYTLRALSRVNAMQTTTESASVHIFNSLGFLLPLILLGHLWQFYTCYRFFQLYFNHPPGGEWQLVAIGGLFGSIGLGNISTTLYTVYQKWRRSWQSPQASSASTSPLINRASKK